MPGSRVRSSSAMPVWLADDDLNPVTLGVAPANAVSSALSGTIATSGGTAAIPFVNTARQEVLNSSTATLWASWGTPAVNGAGSFPIAPGGAFATDRTAGTLTLLSTAATQPYTVNRYS